MCRSSSIIYSCVPIWRFWRLVDPFSNTTRPIRILTFTRCPQELPTNWEALSALVSKVDVWRQQRAGIVKELQTLAVLMKSVLDELGNTVYSAVTGRRVAGRRKGLQGFRGHPSRSSALRGKRARPLWHARIGRGCRQQPSARFENTEVDGSCRLRHPRQEGAPLAFYRARTWSAASARLQRVAGMGHAEQRINRQKPAGITRRRRGQRGSELDNRTRHISSLTRRAARATARSTGTGPSHPADRSGTGRAGIQQRQGPRVPSDAGERGRAPRQTPRGQLHGRHA